MTFNDAEVAQLDAEVLQKFKQIFALESEDQRAAFASWYSSATEDQRHESLQGIYWFGIVEPGWMPSLIQKHWDDESDNEQLEEMESVAEEKACNALGFSPEYIEI